MELRHLRYFVTVVAEQSFTKAAEKLFIAQPPLSRQIQDLEEEIGVQLLERGSRPLKPTQAGQFFYQHALKLLASSEQAVAMTKRIGTDETIFRMGFVGSLLFGLLPRIIYLYRKQHPHLKIELLEMGTLEQFNALKEGRIDVGFGRLRKSDPAIKRILLRNEKLLVAVHSSHPLATKSSQGVHLQELVNENIYVYLGTPKTDILNLFAEYGLEPKTIIELREIQLALGLVAADEGISIIPKSASTIVLRDLHYLPLLNPEAVTPIFMSIRTMEDNKYIDSLLDTIQGIYKTENIK